MAVIGDANCAPLLRQSPGNRSGEDGLAEPFEQRGDAVDAGFEGVDLGHQFIELGGDAGLFGERRKAHFMRFYHRL
ncbi:MAG: hypothetical protein A2180_03335 [Pseudomonadales bacterium GWC2_63_15]|nr:MAG: hypothetical protein A2180_03335 [Pseudomonadales bacterium GWC2_63_15]